MSVYVDDMRAPYRRLIMCHMIADTLVELHAMADLIGLKRAWFQPSSFPHYDVSLTKRDEAIRNGAVLIDRKQLALKMREIRKSWIT